MVSFFILKIIFHFVIRDFLMVILVIIGDKNVWPSFWRQKAQDPPPFIHSVIIFPFSISSCPFFSIWSSFLTLLIILPLYHISLSIRSCNLPFPFDQSSHISNSSSPIWSPSFDRLCLSTIDHFVPPLSLSLRGFFLARSQAHSSHQSSAANRAGSRSLSFLTSPCSSSSSYPPLFFHFIRFILFSDHYPPSPSLSSFIRFFNARRSRTAQSTQSIPPPPPLHIALHNFRAKQNSSIASNLIARSIILRRAGIGALLE